MAKSYLKLVYSADAEEKELDFTNAQQLSLFDEDEANKLYVVPLKELDRFELNELISDVQPSSIFDTREYPEFYSFFQTDSHAISAFEALGASYTHKPISWSKKHLEELCREIEEKLLRDLNALRESQQQSYIKCVVFVQASKGLDIFERLSSSRMTSELENWKIQPAPVALAH